MSLTDEEFRKKACDLVGDVALNIAWIIRPSSDYREDYRIQIAWTRLAYRFFELIET